jgi:hypothetical protein
MNHGHRKQVQVKGIERSNKIIGENFPNLEKETVIQIQQAFSTLNRQDQKVKTLNIQNNKIMFKAAREKCQVTYKGKPIRITADLPKETKSWEGKE